MYSLCEGKKIQAHRDVYLCVRESESQSLYLRDYYVCEGRRDTSLHYMEYYM